jgi:hypothetical protein
MRIRNFSLSLYFLAVTVTFIASPATAITVQSASDVFDSRPFLFVEAESYASLNEDPENDGWLEVSKETPINSVPYQDTLTRLILPADSNVSGTAMLDQLGGGSHTDKATYEVQFQTAGAYQIYLRHTMYDRNANNTFGDEDSIYLSPAFNKNSSTDWIGFETVEYDEQDITLDPWQAGYALDPDGFKSETGDSENDGWYATRDWGVKSEGVVTFPNAQGTEFNGHFNWYGRPVFVGANPAGAFDDDLNFKTQYIVTEEMLGQTLTFEVDTREPYVVIDGFLFIKDDNWDLLDVNSQADLDAGILAPPTLEGDYNEDGSVNAADYAVWRDGGSPDDTQAGYDLWKANFGNSGAGGGAAVPEPASIAMLLVGLAAIGSLSRLQSRRRLS